MKNTLAYVCAVASITLAALQVQAESLVDGSIDAGKSKSVTCAACHGPDGKGMQTVGSANLTDGIWLYGSDKATIVQTITNGRGGVMPAWGGRLSDATIKALTVYVWTFGGGVK